MLIAKKGIFIGLSLLALTSCNHPVVNKYEDIEIRESSAIIIQSCNDVMYSFNRLYDEDRRLIKPYFDAAYKIESLSNEAIYKDTSSSAYIVQHYDSLTKFVLSCDKVSKSFAENLKAKNLLTIPKDVSYDVAKNRVLRLKVETLWHLIRKIGI